MSSCAAMGPLELVFPTNPLELVFLTDSPDLWLVFPTDPVAPMAAPNVTSAAGVAPMATPEGATSTVGAAPWPPPRASALHSFPLSTEQSGSRGMTPAVGWSRGATLMSARHSLPSGLLSLSMVA
jgi:hypothetical protein